MTLKRQLLVVGALTLLIPLAGIQFVVQLEDALREQELARLTDQTERIARYLAQTLDNTGPSVEGPRPDRILFAETFNGRLILDGYGDDWPNRPGENGVPLLYPGGAHVSWRAAVQGDELWLFLRFSDLTPVFAGVNSQAVHDRLVLTWRLPDGTVRENLITARSPGRAMVGSRREGSEADRRIQAFWQTQPDGFTVELRMPRLPAGSLLGFSLDHPSGGGPARTLGEMGWASPPGQPAADARPLPLLVTDRPELQQRLAPFAAPGQTLTLVGPEGWQLATAAAELPEKDTDVSRYSPVELLQQALLQGLRFLLTARQEDGESLAPTGRRWTGAALREARQEGETVSRMTRVSGEPPSLTVVTPVGSGPGAPYLISRRSTDALLSLSSTTLGRVLARSLLLTLVLLLVLVGYATWLSWRITRLRQSVSAVVDDEGRVSGPLQPSSARDELGDLSRHFAGLVSQLRSYTQYLESFARKLSHELKTPLAVMRSSLDNLRHTEPSDAQLTYLDRASEGADRLSRILTAMSEASRLERSLVRTDRESFDLAQVLAMAAEGYRNLDSRVHYQGPDGPCPMLGAPDLLVQALDKLIENARDFTPPDGAIQLQLVPAERHWQVSVCNDGPPLPAGMTEHIFDSFISVRAEGQNSGHLGQGLVIVKLVADFHHARVQATNRADGRGACFTLHLPHHPTVQATQAPPSPDAAQEQGPL